ncbi:putative aarF domain-containing protein kinase [Arachis hypogaea]|nr:putative aarF domain-containing protein kinase [Arachis hypogaea]
MATQSYLLNSVYLRGWQPSISKSSTFAVPVTSKYPTKRNINGSTSRTLQCCSCYKEISEAAAAATTAQTTLDSKAVLNSVKLSIPETSLHYVPSDFMKRQLCGSIPDVVIPLMYKDYTTHKVLVMEWVEGKKLSEVKDLYLIEIGAHSINFLSVDSIMQIHTLEIFFEHFGMTGEFKQELRDGFIQACLHLVNRDFDALSKDFVTLGCLPKCCCPRSSQYQLWRPFRKLRNHHDGVFRVDRLESLLTESLRAKTEKSLVKQQPEGTDSRMAMKEILSFTLTEKGEYVREIIVQEFAKGFDALGLATLETAASRVPFSGFFFSSLMIEEDVNNLRTFQRLLLLLSGTR